MFRPSLQLAGSAFTCSLLLAGMCLGQTTERVSVDSLGVQGNDSSSWPSMSADGRFMAFNSGATNLVPGDTNGDHDIFVHDRQTGVTELVSVNSLGVQGNDESDYPSISADGRCVAFISDATNFVSGGFPWGQIYVHDRQTGVTETVSLDSLGVQGNDECGGIASLSADARYVAFESKATNLVPGDTNWDSDVFVHDRQTGVTELVSVDAFGEQGVRYSVGPSLSADGRYVAFGSNAANLIHNDSNLETDTFVHDRLTGVTERVSVDSLGGQGNDFSGSPSISADGRHVAFYSEATNLVPGDTNGATDIFVHDRWNGLGANSIALFGATTSPIQSPVPFYWWCTRGNSRYWLLFSQNQSGSVIRGHAFDIGTLNHGGILATGTHAANGYGSFTYTPRLAYAGHTIYFEVAAQDADGILYDSNVLPIAFY